VRSAFAGFRFPPDVIVVAVRWYLRFGLSYRDVEELLAERGVEVDHVTVYRWGAAVHADVFVSARRDTMAAHRFFPAAHRHDEGGACGGRHRPSSDLSDGAQAVATRGMASNRAVRQQSG
jgi:transposase-like protein